MSALAAGNSFAHNYIFRKIIMMLSYVLIILTCWLSMYESIFLHDVSIVAPILMNRDGRAVPVLEVERSGTQKCSFQAEKKKLASCDMETDEHKVVNKYINKDSIVLELGARYGTTSCQIAHRQGNSGLTLGVEIDPTVWAPLSANQKSHNCNFYILQGVVGNKEVQIFGSGYGTKALPPDEMLKHNLQGAVHGADGKMIKKGINKSLAGGGKKRDRQAKQALLAAQAGAGDVAEAQRQQVTSDASATGSTAAVSSSSFASSSSSDPGGIIVAGNTGTLVETKRQSKKTLNLTTVPAISFPELNERMDNIFAAMMEARSSGQGGGGSIGAGAGTSVSSGAAISTVTATSIKSTHYYFNTLLIDCEGCLNNLFVEPHKPESLKRQLAHVHTIILEADMPVGHCLYYCVDYALWIQRFNQAGLVIKYQEQDRVYSFITHYVFLRA